MKLSLLLVVFSLLLAAQAQAEGTNFFDEANPWALKITPPHSQEVDEGL